MRLEGLQTWGGLVGREAAGAEVVVVGLPYDGSAVYRKGAAAAPIRLRELSRAVPPVTEHGVLMTTKVRDLGDLDLGAEVETGWTPVAEELASLPPETFLTVLGGDHCSMIPVLAAQARRHPGLAVVWIDAHPDLNDFSRGGPWTCGCALRRALDCSGLAPSDVALAGVRDFDYEEIDFAGTRGLSWVSCAKVATDPAAVGRELATLFAGRPVHVSFDIDVLDPAFAPGTEIPAAGGLSTRDALNLLAALAEGSRLVGLDVAEVSPPLDPTDITSFAALKLIFETWGFLSPSRPGGEGGGAHGNR